MTDVRPLAEVDSEMSALIRADVDRQRTHIQLIASENFASRAVMQATGSVFTNKYSEGYPGRRYYEGCSVVDSMENLARERALALFGAEHANVQPHSGAQANMGVYFGLLEPGDTVLGMRLDQGGHLTHGSPVNFSGALYKFVSYGVAAGSERVDMDEVREVALRERPRMIVAGYSAYSRILDWGVFREIADEVGALLMVDAAHVIGLIAGGAHPSPVPHAQIVTATTHKALRGPRGGFILCHQELAKDIDKGVFPNAQGGPLDNHIAAKAVCFKEASTAEFGRYAQQVVANAAAMADQMASEGIRVVSGGTDNHLFLIDLRSVSDDLDGKEASRLLDSVGITLNANAIPFDPRPPFRPSGLRLGTPAVTTCGMGEQEVRAAATLISRALRERQDDKSLAKVRGAVADLVAAFPPYSPDFPGHV
jgi:glycine hydroxymethyltransferase